MVQFASPQRFISVLKSMHFAYLRKLFSYAFSRYPTLYYAVGVYILSVVLEVVAMSAFVPLSEIASGKTTMTPNLLVQLMAALSIKTSAKYIFLAYIVLFSLRVITNILAERLLTNVTSNKIPAQFMAQGLGNVLQNYDISTIERKSAGQLIMLAGEEVHRAASIVATTIRFSSATVLIALYYITIASFSPPTAVVILIILALTASASYSTFRAVHRLGIKTTESSRTATSIFVDALNGVRSVRAFGAEEYVLNKFKDEIFPHKRRLFLIEFFTLLGKQLPMLMLVAVYGLYILVGTQLSRAAFDYAFAITLLIFLLRFFLAVGDAVNVFLRIVSDAKAAQDVTEVIDAENLNRDGTLKHHDLHPDVQKPIATITLDNVAFSYNKHDFVLWNFSTAFERGKSYAIVGESGAGKSTLLDILLKFHTPDHGTILLNGQPIAGIDERALRRKIVLLGQETIIFNDTVTNNICYGFHASREEIVAAARLAYVDEVINELPQNYETVLQYRGTNLSGGQRQRIGIARALLRKPDVLVLDESMSALDPITKEAVMKNILSEYSKKIVIFVSHDPAIREHVDEVVAMKKYEPELKIATP
jgi:ABC-type multidrug transport system fused ATPase/permease subunit